MSMLVHLATGRIDRPQFALGRSTKRLKDIIPNTGITPLLPPGVNRRVWRKDAQGSPSAALAKAKEHRLKHNFWSRLRASPLLLALASTGLTIAYAEINFFSSLTLNASFSEIRIMSMLELKLILTKYKKNLQFSNTP